MMSILSRCSTPSSLVIRLCCRDRKNRASPTSSLSLYRKFKIDNLLFLSLSTNFQKKLVKSFLIPFGGGGFTDELLRPFSIHPLPPSNWKAIIGCQPPPPFFFLIASATFESWLYWFFSLSLSLSSFHLPLLFFSSSFIWIMMISLSPYCTLVLFLVERCESRSSSPPVLISFFLSLSSGRQMKWKIKIKKRRRRSKSVCVRVRVEGSDRYIYIYWNMEMQLLLLLLLVLLVACTSSGGWCAALYWF
jgi:hypothetical protein